MRSIVAIVVCTSHRPNVRSSAVDSLSRTSSWGASIPGMGRSRTVLAIVKLADVRSNDEKERNECDHCEAWGLPKRPESEADVVKRPAHNGSVSYNNAR